MKRIIILGTGTGIGKTYVSRELTLQLGRREQCLSAIAIKPLETGVPSGASDSDASVLAAASSPQNPSPTPPLYVLPTPCSPHLSARRASQTIDVQRVADWVREHEKPTDSTTRQYNTLHNECLRDNADDTCSPAQASPKQAATAMAKNPEILENGANSSSHPRATRSAALQFLVVETAGAVFSPLNARETNFDLARELDPAIWILVAPDRLGVLHDLTVTLFTMKAMQRVPDFIVLSQPDPSDPSIGTNAGELGALSIADVAALVPYGTTVPQELIDQIIERATRSPDA